MAGPPELSIRWLALARFQHCNPGLFPIREPSQKPAHSAAQPFPASVSRGPAHFLPHVISLSLSLITVAAIVRCAGTAAWIRRPRAATACPSEDAGVLDRPAAGHPRRLLRHDEWVTTHPPRHRALFPLRPFGGGDRWEADPLLGRDRHVLELIYSGPNLMPSLLCRAQRHGEDCEDGGEDDRESGRAAHSGAAAAGRDSGAVCSHQGAFWTHPILTLSYGYG